MVNPCLVRPSQGESTNAGANCQPVRRNRPRTFSVLQGAQVRTDDSTQCVNSTGPQPRYRANTVDPQ
jgi:hypothetical protein